MKYFAKLIFSLFSAIIFSSLIFAQVPNSGFENWTGSEPDQWMTNNSFPDLVTISKSTTAHSGSYSIRGDVVSYFGFPWVPSLNSGAGNSWGFPVAQHYNFLNGYYQFSDPGNSSILFASATEYGVDGTDTIAVAVGYMVAGETAPGFQPFAIEILQLMQTPPAQYCQITFTVLDTVSGLATVGTYFLVDDLTLSGTTAISANEEIPAPREFGLEQNYPNPFNPETTIRYNIDKDSHVLLRVFDITGREIAILVNEAQNAGQHEIRWNAENNSGGIYFYQITAENNTQTRKMMLLK